MAKNGKAYTVRPKTKKKRRVQKTRPVGGFRA